MLLSQSPLKNVKHTPEAGAVDVAAHAEARTRLLRALPDAVFESAPAASSGYVVGFLQSLVYKPVAISAAAFVFLAGGWMTTSAAQESLPGDTLYNVKLIAERAQLQLASLDRRAVLHTEFAGRRLEEVAALQRATEREPEERTQYISEAVSAYQQEIASATTDLQELQSQDQNQALETAAIVLDQVAVLTQNAEGLVSEAQNSSEQGSQNPNDSSSDVPETVAEQVTQTTEAIANAATLVAIDAHEASPTESSVREMENIFRGTLGEIEARRAMVMHRIEKIEQLTREQKAALAQAGVVLPGKSTFTQAKNDVSAMDDKLPEIMDNFAAGGYRSALDALKEMDVALATIEESLVSVEDSVMQALTQAGKDEVR